MYLTFDFDILFVVIKFSKFLVQYLTFNLYWINNVFNISSSKENLKSLFVSVCLLYALKHTDPYYKPDI